MDWIKSSIWEIKKSTSLRYLGLFLSLSHILTFVEWSAVYSAVDTGSDVLCWNFFPRCTEAAFVSGGGGALYTYLALSILSALLFLLGPIALGVAWSFLVSAASLKLAIYLFDFRLFSNTHTLLFFVEIAYLFVPNKKNLIKSLFLFFFLTSALLRVNSEWLTGFYFESLELPTKVNEWLAALTILIEITLPFLLFSKNMKRIVLWVLLMTLYLIGMSHFSNYFFTAHTFLIMMLFPFSYSESKPANRNYIYSSFIRPEPSKVWTPIGLITFVVLQTLPVFINLEWPTTPLEITQAKLPVECQQNSFAIFKNSVQILDNSLAKETSQVKCNSQVRMNKLIELCQSYKKKPDFETIFSSFAKRGFADSQFKTVFEIADICNFLKTKNR